MFVLLQNVTTPFYSNVFLLSLITTCLIGQRYEATDYGGVCLQQQVLAGATARQPATF